MLFFLHLVSKEVDKNVNICWDVPLIEQINNNSAYSLLLTHSVFIKASL